ncbi:MAG: 1,4-alpha-glucan-branching enzyme, partial [Desulfobacteraceae bacterium]|nr:1,4-alpha-glucan-branching enzyme [Desulfobacteraceae bacterium]
MTPIDNDAIAARVRRLVMRDSLLAPYADVIGNRLRRMEETATHLAPRGFRWSEATLAHQRYGLHRQADGWVFRDWAPGAEAIFLVGDHSGWREDPRFALRRENDGGDWVVRLPPETLGHERLYRLRVYGAMGGGDRIPAYARRVVQDPVTGIFNAQ